MSSPVSQPALRRAKGSDKSGSKHRNVRQKSLPDTPRMDPLLRLQASATAQLLSPSDAPGPSSSRTGRSKRTSCSTSHSTPSSSGAPKRIRRPNGSTAAPHRAPSSTSPAAEEPPHVAHGAPRSPTRAPPLGVEPRGSPAPRSPSPVTVEPPVAAPQDADSALVPPDADLDTTQQRTRNAARVSTYISVFHFSKRHKRPDHAIFSLPPDDRARSVSFKGLPRDRCSSPTASRDYITSSLTAYLPDGDSAEVIAGIKSAGFMFFRTYTFAVITCVSTDAQLKLKAAWEQITTVHPDDPARPKASVFIWQPRGHQRSRQRRKAVKVIPTMSEELGRLTFDSLMREIKLTWTFSADDFEFSHSLCNLPVPAQPIRPDNVKDASQLCVSRLVNAALIHSTSCIAEDDHLDTQQRKLDRISLVIALMAQFVADTIGAGIPYKTDAILPNNDPAPMWVKQLSESVSPQALLSGIIADLETVYGKRKVADLFRSLPPTWSAVWQRHSDLLLHPKRLAPPRQAGGAGGGGEDDVDGKVDGDADGESDVEGEGESKDGCDAPGDVEGVSGGSGGGGDVGDGSCIESWGSESDGGSTASWHTTSDVDTSAGGARVSGSGGGGGGGGGGSGGCAQCPTFLHHGIIAPRQKMAPSYISQNFNTH